LRFLEARATGFGLERLPIERDGGGIEERAVERLVFAIALAGTELVEVEDMRAEDEVVRDLLDLHLGPFRQVTEFKVAVGHAIALDIAIDPGLLLGIPELPVGLAHDLVLSDTGRGGQEQRRGQRSPSQSVVLHDYQSSGQY